MKRSGRWAVGAAAAVAPILALASPASAAQASDDASGTGGYKNVNGIQVNCGLNAHHEVDTDNGQLAVRFTTGGGACQGTITVAISYVNRDGRAARTESTARQASEQDLTLFDVGSTKVTVDYSVSFDGCTFLCETATVQTQTK